MKSELITAALAGAKKAGIENIVALRGGACPRTPAVDGARFV